MTYDFYPFNSPDKIWQEGNKALLIENEGLSMGFVCIEKNMINEKLRSIAGASEIVIGKHYAKVEFIYPLLNRSLLRIIRDSQTKRLRNARELSNGDPTAWVNSMAEIEEQYQKDLNDVGYTHLTYGFNYPGSPEVETVVDALKNLEKQILEF